MKRKSLLNRIIYSITKKPKHCVAIKNPPKTITEKLLHPQKARQVQYNNWSRRFRIYSGSYLPKEHNELKKKGWKEKKASDNKHHIYQRKSTNQTVRYDDLRIKKDGSIVPAHWHWLVWWKNYFGKKTRKRFNKAKNSEKIYYNKYGEKTTKNKGDYHL